MKTEDTFQDVSDEELAVEVQRRRAVRIQKQTDEAMLRADFLLANVDALIAVTPDHSRTSCDDGSLGNSYTNDMGYPRCVRCFLLDAKRTNYWDAQVAMRIALEPNEYDS